ncbi:SRPBCC domain-containing protein [Streptomyces sp. NBC_01352]|uniref:SRPBCC domain-containing protein n=1 Tax=Streptomyces sp. NBC_01352 TaxID=2903834 RepID=UPI002E2F3B81|nr:SRPBCC domain-containing protein [Streptomyces sp. NBC_01352]
MEHEVFVPVPVDRLREALADPARVARAVPGLQQDAGAEPIAGRLKVRVGSHSVTYRGSVRVSGQDDGSYAVEGEAVEARGTGAVKLALTIRVREADESSDSGSGSGSTVTFDGTASADGRVTELPSDAVASAVGRLLSRFAENLGVAAEEPQEPEAMKAPEPQAPEPQAPEPQAPEPEAPAAVPEPPSVFETEDLTEPVVPPAEAAHARRTMIGRSAEEVDHAPPRGRYAPVPAPHTGGANSALRWAAPAAAVVLASAIVVGRALRRRR